MFLTLLKIAAAAWLALFFFGIVRFLVLDFAKWWRANRA